VKTGKKKHENHISREEKYYSISCELKTQEKTTKLDKNSSKVSNITVESFDELIKEY